MGYVKLFLSLSVSVLIYLLLHEGDKERRIETRDGVKRGVMIGIRDRERKREIEGGRRVNSHLRDFRMSSIKWMGNPSRLRQLKRFSVPIQSTSFLDILSMCVHTRVKTVGVCLTLPVVERQVTV